jgi:hypothetical protein
MSQAGRDSAALAGPNKVRLFFAPISRAEPHQQPGLGKDTLKPDNYINNPRNPALYFTSQREGCYGSIEIFDYVEDSTWNLEQATIMQEEKGGTLFDFEALEAKYLKTKRDEWGFPGGWNIHIALNTESGEVSVDTCDKSSGLHYTSPWEVINYAVVNGAFAKGLELYQFLFDEYSEKLAEEYWEAVVDKFEELLDEKKIEIDLETRKHAFDREDGDDGHGGSVHPDTLAERVVERLEAEAIDRGAALICEIVVDHPKGPDTFETVGDAEAFFDEIMAKDGNWSEYGGVCYFRKDNYAPCDSKGQTL